MRDTPQDFDDRRSVDFRGLDDDKTLSRKKEAAIVAQQFLLEPQPQPERAKPCDQKTARRQEDLLPSFFPQNSAQENQDDRHRASECRPVVRRKSGIQEVENTIIRTLNYARSAKVILPDLVKGFFGMFHTAVKPQHQSRDTGLDCRGVD